MKCPACERIEAIDNFKNNPTQENYKKLVELIKCERGFIISGIENLSQLKDCPLHNTFEGYKNFLLFLNSEEIVKLIFGDEDKIMC